MVPTRIIHHAKDIDWALNKSQILISPKTPPHIIKTIEQIPFESFEPYLWVLTSGTSSSDVYKLIGHTQQSVEASAKSVNKHLESSQNDIWLNVLPSYHVGGLTIFERAKLSGAKVIDKSQDKWSAQNYYQNITDHKVTLSSLVPTQLIDLIEFGKEAPHHLRALVIGGGALSDFDYQRARKLNWPVLPSFGMTETCSQIATASLSSLKYAAYPSLDILEHAECRLDKDNFLEIKAASLFKCQIKITPQEVLLLDPEFDWFKTEDYAEVSAGTLKPKGRGFLVKKVNGHLVNLQALSEVWNKLNRDHNSVLIFNLHPRSENQVDLVVEDLKGVEPLVDVFNSQVKPQEKIRNIYCIEKIPKTDLNKVKYQELLKKLSKDYIKKGTQ